MRIVLANTYHFGGGGDSTYTFNLGELLEKNRHEVAFFAMHDTRNVPDPHSDLFVSHISFRELRRHMHMVAGMQVLWRSVYSVEARKKFSILINRFKPDMIHLQNIHAHITPSVIFEAKRHSLPVVWTLHDHKLICPNTHFMVDVTGAICQTCGKRAYYQAVLRRCKKGSILASAMASLEAYAHWFMRVRDKVDAFISPSQFLRHKVISRGFQPKKVHHLPLFVPEACFNRSRGCAGYFLFLGKIEPIKGIKTMMEACRLAQEARLVLTGGRDGPYAAECQREAPRNATFVGFKQGRELQQLRDGARALILPSLCYENQPFGILEAFACGKPVIASNLGGMTELVKDGERGILVPPGDVKALAEAMKWMVNHPREAAKMGKAARAYALREHNAETHYQRLMAIYKKVLN